MKIDVNTYNYDDTDIPSSYVDVSFEQLFREYLTNRFGYDCYYHLEQVLHEYVYPPDQKDFFKEELGVSKEQLIKILKDVAPEEFV